MDADNTHRQVTTAVSEGLVDGTAFFSSIITGTVLGLAADWILGTEPWLVVTGTIVGAYSGFLAMWRASARMETARSLTREIE